MLLQMARLHSFLWLSNIPLYMYIYHIFFIHSSVDGHLGCFHVLAIVNSAAPALLFFTRGLSPSILPNILLIYFVNVVPPLPIKI